MKQELGETKQEMMKSDDQAVQDILNDRPAGHYWIVIHHKPLKKKLTTGEQILMRHIKAYDTKPVPQIGMVILEVKDGEIIDHIVSPHDVPIDWEEIEKHAGLIETPSVLQSPTARGYVYNE